MNQNLIWSAADGYWNNGQGWVGHRSEATRFTDEEKDKFLLPIGGRWEKVQTLEDLLEDWQVDEPGMWTNDQGPEGWWAVSNGDEAIIAYFAKPEDAYRWRLDMINKELNG